MNDQATVTSPPRPPEGGAWAPLRDMQFRSLWLAFLGSQLVVWMNTVGAATVIATLGGSSTLVALVQTATSLPAVLLALLAGAVTDIVDRRRLLLATQSWMLLSAAAAAVLTLAHVATPASILLLTFSLGVGMAASLPAFQSLTPEFAGPGHLGAGVALNSVAINLARAVGPALAGVVIAAVSAGALFAVEAAGVAAIIALVVSLRRPAAAAGDTPEHVLSAVRAGARFVRYSPAVRAVLLRALLFVTGASAFWALLPVIAFGRSPSARPAWACSWAVRAPGRSSERRCCPVCAGGLRSISPSRWGPPASRPRWRRSRSYMSRCSPESRRSRAARRGCQCSPRSTPPHRWPRRTGFAAGLLPRSSSRCRAGSPRARSCGAS